MPTYEYRRPDGSTFEIQQSFSDEPLTVDPETGVAVQLVLHAPAVHFKGKGFYNTDYGTRNRQRETAAAAAEKSTSEGSSSAGDSAKSSSEDKAKSESAAKDSSGKDSSGKESGGKESGGKESSGRGSAKTKDSKPVAAKG
jgi:predicted nucleic acid-binding Zn ribbon protein